MLRYLAVILLTAVLTVGTVNFLDTEQAHPAPVCSSDADCVSEVFPGDYAVSTENGSDVDPRLTCQTPGDCARVLGLDAYAAGETDGPDPIADCLLARGYRGLPTDHAEAIYAPRDVIEWCAAKYNPDPIFVAV
jgi:hypothetical protein